MKRDQFLKYSGSSSNCVMQFSLSSKTRCPHKLTFNILGYTCSTFSYGHAAVVSYVWLGITLYFRMFSLKLWLIRIFVVPYNTGLSKLFSIKQLEVQHTCIF